MGAMELKLVERNISGRARSRVLLVLLESTLLVVALLGCWLLFLNVSGVTPYVGKAPSDIWRYLATDRAAAANRGLLLHASRTTLADATAGFVFGMTGAYLCSVAFVVSRGLYRVGLPVIVLVQSVPIVAMLPLLILIVGRGIGAAIAISAIVSFFPAFAIMSFGLRSMPVHALDLFRAYGASRTATLKLLRVPASMPAVFAAARFAAPSAVLGALLSEWLAIGRGLGNLMLLATTHFDFTQLWAAAVLIVTFAILLHAAIGAAESWAIRRFSYGMLAEHR